MKKLILGTDANGKVDYGIPFVDLSDGHSISMAAAATATLTVPSEATKALIQIQPGATVWVGPSAITGPTASFATQDADINPTLRDVQDVSTLHFLAVDAAEIKVSFYEQRIMGPTIFDINDYSNGGLYDADGGTVYTPPPPPPRDDYEFMDQSNFQFMNASQFDFN